jgi:hypothetical protein
MTATALLRLTEFLTALKLLLGLVIVGLAAYGYRRNASRPMLFLGSGIALMTVVSTVATAVSGVVLGATFAAPSGVASEVTGMCLILYAIVLARRQ